MAKVIKLPQKVKHTPESKKFADILHSNWPKEFNKDGTERKNG